MDRFQRCVSAAMSTATVALFTFTASAVPIDPVIAPGTATQYDEWLPGSLTAVANPGYGGFPGSAPWPGPIGSSAPGSGDAELVRIADGAAGGGPVPLGASIYFGSFLADDSNGGTLAVVDTTPVANLANVIFQLDLGEAASPNSFFEGTLPTLSFNGGAQNLAATDFTIVDHIELNDRNTYLLQWDMTGFTGITEFAITFSAIPHAQLYALRLEQSDQYVPFAFPDQAAAMPEPASLTLLAMGTMTLLRRRNR